MRLGPLNGVVMGIKAELNEAWVEQGIYQVLALDFRGSNGRIVAYHQPMS